MTKSSPIIQLLIAAGLLGAAVPSLAKTISAASCLQPAVQAAVNSASDGDKVVVPAGTCKWSSAVSIKSKTIILQGAGSATGGTKITHSGGDHTLISVDAGARTGRMEISGFWFFGAGNTWNGTAMQLYGPVGWKNLRVHHNVFEGNHPWTIKAGAYTHGLIDNNVFKGKAFGIMLYGQGAKDWSAPLNLGTGDFFFIENNTFAWDDWYGATGVPTVDMDEGGRHVFRNNTVKNGMWETHDKARSGLVSANAYEIYNNTFTASTNKWKGLDISAGTGVVWGNTFTGDWTVPIGAIDYKTSDPRSVRRCDGSDPADQNVAGQSGWRCQYQIGTMSEGSKAYSYPLYVWSNRKNGSVTDMNCTAGCTHVQKGRDYVNNGTTAKPGYTPFVFPHPLSNSGSTVLKAPTSLRAVP